MGEERAGEEGRQKEGIGDDRKFEENNRGREEKERE